MKFCKMCQLKIDVLESIRIKPTYLRRLADEFHVTTSVMHKILHELYQENEITDADHVPYAIPNNTRLYMKVKT